MPIVVKANISYGQLNGNTKYSPFIDINLPSRNECNAILNIRPSLFASMGLLPEAGTVNLHLQMTNWAAALGAEQVPHRPPPLVVISSNRSQWIRDGLLAAQTHMPEVDNVSNLRALVGGGDVSPPVYSPLRDPPAAGAPPRNVYVIVNSREYETYCAALNIEEPGRITVVGWEFDRPRRGPFELVGFGPTRFAAIALCKELMPRIDGGWTSAWILDDNIVAFTGFPGFTHIENALNDKLCAGFGGATSINTRFGNRGKAQQLIDKGFYREVDDAKLGEPDLVQQAGLYNIALLADGPHANLNFSPMFITSAEDLSFSNYMRIMKIRYNWYSSIKIMKEQPDEDNNVVKYGDNFQGGAKLRKTRALLVGRISAVESCYPIRDLIPPVIVQPADDKMDKEQRDIAAYMVWVLKNAGLECDQNSEPDQKSKPNLRLREVVASQAVEQIMSRIIESGYGNQPQLNALFTVGNRVQVKKIDSGG